MESIHEAGRARSLVGGTSADLHTMRAEASSQPVIHAAPVATLRAQLGESPLWDAKVGLRWLDVPGQRLATLGADGREYSVPLSSRVTAIELGPAQCLLAVTTNGFGWLDPDSGAIERVLTILGDATLSMNDAAVDARGRCWTGSALSDIDDRSGRGELYCLEGARPTVQARDIGMSNGIDWSPDSDVFYHVDSIAGTLTAWEYDLPAGRLGASRVLRSVPRELGLPDGLAVDTQGNVWLAVWGPGEVWRLDPKSGRTTAVIKVPTPCTTSCAFGGDDLSTLYITTANYNEPPGGGLLYAAKVPAQGRQPHRFSGTLR